MTESVSKAIQGYRHSQYCKFYPVTTLESGDRFKNALTNSMMTSSNGNIFRVTGPLCGEFTGPGEFPTQRPVTRSFDVFFDLHPNKRLSKQWRCWWFEAQTHPLWRQCNAKIWELLHLHILTKYTRSSNVWVIFCENFLTLIPDSAGGGGVRNHTFFISLLDLMTPFLLFININLFQVLKSMVYDNVHWKSIGCMVLYMYQLHYDPPCINCLPN